MPRFSELLIKEDRSEREQADLESLANELEQIVYELADILGTTGANFRLRATFQRALNIYTNGYAAADLSRGVLFHTRNDAKVTGYMGLRNSANGIMTLGVDDLLGTNNTATRIAFRHDLTNNSEDGAMFFSGNGSDIIGIFHEDNTGSDQTIFRLFVGSPGATTTEVEMRGGADGNVTVFNEQGRDIDFRVEGATVPDVFKVDAGADKVLIGGPKSDTGDPAGVEGMLYINTFDNAVRMYADGAWRTLASW